MKNILPAIFIFAVSTILAVPDLPADESSNMQIQESSRIYRNIERTIHSAKVIVRKKILNAESIANRITLVSYRFDNSCIKYTVEYGSKDSYLILNHFYDDSGNLRYVFAKYSYISGGSAEYRIYFDSEKTEIHHERKILEKGASPFPDAINQYLIVFDPESDFQKSK